MEHGRGIEVTGYIKLFWAEAPEGEPPAILYDGAIEITPIPTMERFRACRIC
nr:hypothetical protein [uncultured Acetatifactor sp.]